LGRARLGAEGWSAQALRTRLCTHTGAGQCQIYAVLCSQEVLAGSMLPSQHKHKP
jgi:hypothetical protein